jgi:hypothetical protein
MRIAKGYYWHKHNLRYQVQFKIKGQVIYGGSYDTEEDAHQAYLRGREFYREQAKNTKGRL